ncbi:hypothetical protein THAOC_04196 [Thalassiosira oceanica]|uniref:Uncharacterized protein n=1 Tax=Thalassiosira oceanica TaxID=159749 RepID=K0TAL7_THAOC|nr:hypothetical protein THAOC_04196 [Thalassiosira oceanica]|eukprot:EJK74144.1 hypothetical protein THAOC_04196 [Thalassiosira oceanica]
MKAIFVILTFGQVTVSSAGGGYLDHVSRLLTLPHLVQDLRHVVAVGPGTVSSVGFFVQRDGDLEGLARPAVVRAADAYYPAAGEDPGPASSSSSKKRMETWGRRITGKLHEGIATLAE